MQVMDKDAGKLTDQEISDIYNWLIQTLHLSDNKMTGKEIKAIFIAFNEYQGTVHLSKEDKNKTKLGIEYNHLIDAFNDPSLINNKIQTPPKRLETRQFILLICKNYLNHEGQGFKEIVALSTKEYRNQTGVRTTRERSKSVLRSLVFWKGSDVEVPQSSLTIANPETNEAVKKSVTVNDSRAQVTPLECLAEISMVKQQTLDSPKSPGGSAPSAKRLSVKTSPLPASSENSPSISPSTLSSQSSSTTAKAESADPKIVKSDNFNINVMSNSNDARKTFMNHSRLIKYDNETNQPASIDISVRLEKLAKNFQLVIWDDVNGAKNIFNPDMKLTEAHYKDLDAYIIICDVNDPSFCKRLVNLHDQILSELGYTPFVLVITNIDKHDNADELVHFMKKQKKLYSLFFDCTEELSSYMVNKITQDTIDTVLKNQEKLQRQVNPQPGDDNNPENKRGCFLM